MTVNSVPMRKFLVQIFQKELLTERVFGGPNVAWTRPLSWELLHQVEVRPRLLLLLKGNNKILLPSITVTISYSTTTVVQRQ